MARGSATPLGANNPTGLIRKQFIPRPGLVEMMRKKHRHELDSIMGHICRRLLGDYSGFSYIFKLYLKLEELERPIKGQNVNACWRLIMRWDKSGWAFDLWEEYKHLDRICNEAIWDDVAGFYRGRKQEAL